MKVRVKEGTNRIIARALIVLVVIIIGVLVGFVAIELIQKYRQSSEDAVRKPWIPEGIAIDDTTGKLIWQEDWVRYNGQIYDYNDEITTYLVMGIDKMTKVKPAKNWILGGQSDAMFLVVMNGQTKTMELIPINRDTICDVDMYETDGSFIATLPAQITLQHGYGDGMEISCERTVNTVSRLFYNIPIHGYVAVNMGAIPAINDVVGGVEVTVPHDMLWYIDKKEEETLKAGTTLTLMGMDAFHYIHDRDITVFNSAGMRLERQKQYLNAYSKKMIAACKEDITIPVQLYKTLSEYMVTDVTIDEVAMLAISAMQYEFSGENIHTLAGETIPGERFEEFHLDQEAFYETILDIFYIPVETAE